MLLNGSIEQPSSSTLAATTTASLTNKSDITPLSTTSVLHTTGPAKITGVSLSLKSKFSRNRNIQQKDSKSSVSSAGTTDQVTIGRGSITSTLPASAATTLPTASASQRPQALKRSSNSYSSTSSIATSSSYTSAISTAGTVSPASIDVDSPCVRPTQLPKVDSITLEEHLFDDQQLTVEERSEAGSIKSDIGPHSMRRRATETIAANLIPNTLRSVFRENLLNNSSFLATGVTVASEVQQQPPPPPPQPSSPIDSTSLRSSSAEESFPSMTRRPALPEQNSSGRAVPRTAGQAEDMPSIKFIPHQDTRSSRPSLAFGAMTRTLPKDTDIIRVGRYSERDVSPNANNVPSSAPIGFKSKVVSRRHCEFWCKDGQWYVKDVKSSSGTFLNHIRLSQPSTESKPFPVNDGDIVQLGMDFRGGEESIFRCVKIRIEVNRGWQKKINEYNTTTHKQLRALAKEQGPTSSTECSICLLAIAPCQALFVAPCSHVWHYKCIKPILTNPKTAPQFLCPNCRAITDLDADIEDTLDGWDETEIDGQDTSPEEAAKRTETPVDRAGNDESSGAQAANAESPNSEPLVAPRIVAPQQDIEMSSDNGIDDSGVGSDVNAISFSESAPITIRDPRTVPEALEGVVTPRNEAGPFVFDGTGQRVQQQATEAAS